MIFRHFPAGSRDFFHSPHFYQPENESIFGIIDLAVTHLIDSCCPGVCSKFGIAPEAVARVLIVAENVGVMISPLTPALFLGLGMVDLDIGDHIRYSLPWIWACSLIAIVLSVVMGVVPF